MKRETVLRLIYIVVLAGSAVWLLAIISAPALRARSPLASRFLYLVFGPTCHQIPSRCFTWKGAPLAVCARCSGIYAGFFLGAVAYPWIRGFSRFELPRVPVFLFFTAPIVLDAAGNFLGLWNSAAWLRFSVGLFWGLLLPYYVITAAADLALKGRLRK